MKYETFDYRSYNNSTDSTNWWRKSAPPHSSFINASRHLDLIGFVKNAFVKPTCVETSRESNIGAPERPKLKTNAGLCEWRHATIDTACAHRYASKCRTAVVKFINHSIRFYGNHCGSRRIYRHAEWKEQLPLGSNHRYFGEARFTYRERVIILLSTSCNKRLSR